VIVLWCAPLHRDPRRRRTRTSIFRVGPRLGDAANAADLSDLFKHGAIPDRLKTDN
jgi:hypothetical protein